jgi:hypothetical protein
VSPGRTENHRGRARGKPSSGPTRDQPNVASGTGARGVSLELVREIDDIVSR